MNRSSARIAGLIPAAQYVRTSKPFQETFAERQKAIIAEYAEGHGYRIIEKYEDLARSGMVINYRKGMQKLLLDVLEGNANYQAILVYDIPRWGRYLDSDEAAHYEFLCKSAGIPVFYCNEAFTSGSRTFSLFKDMRRYQAGEFSRELSEKTYHAAHRIASLGFRIGGAPGYGFRRVLVSETGEHLQQLDTGQFKHNKNFRTILVPGPAAEVKVVREIFRMAATGKVNCQHIANALNRRKLRFCTGKAWDYYDIRRIIFNPKYVGTNVWGRTSQRFRTKPREMPLKDWTVRENAFFPLVDKTLFSRAQTALQQRKPKQWSDQELLTRLKALLRQKGFLNQRMINETPGMPSSMAYRTHFGPWKKIYRLIGYKAPRGTFTKIERRRQNEKLRLLLLTKVAALFPHEVSMFHLPNHRRMILRLDNGLSISIVLCRTIRLSGNRVAWKIYPTLAERQYITLLCRLNETNDGFLDFWLFPSIEKRSWYRFTDDDRWFRSAKRLHKLEELCVEAKALSRLDSASVDLTPTIDDRNQNHGPAPTFRRRVVNCALHRISNLSRRKAKE